MLPLASGLLRTQYFVCRVLAADVREVYSSICQLFELFLLEVFRSFSDVPLAQIVGETPTSQTSAAAPIAPQPDEVGVALPIRG